MDQESAPRGDGKWGELVEICFAGFLAGKRVNYMLLLKSLAITLRTSLV